MRYLLLAAAALSAAPASAITINLIDVGGVTAGSDAAKGFQTAANFWSARLTNNATINLNVGFSALGTNILGQTSSTSYVAPVSSVVSAIRAGGNSQLDAIAKTTLGQWSSGSLSMITPGYVNTVTKTGATVKTSVFDTDGSINNTQLGVTSANAKALGLGVASGAIDATIKFSSTFGFDFNPTDGISAGKIDFVGVAIHEIGHALGFVSGVDDYDYISAGNGPGAASYANYAVNNDWWGYALDLFRYGINSKNLGGAGPKLDWKPGDPTYFSIDGSTAYKGGYFSTGSYNGDKWQASHWKRTSGKAAIGVLDPAVAYGQQDVVTAEDLAALDAIGWNVDINVVSNASWRMSTAQIGLASGLFSGTAIGADPGTGGSNVQLVPEPASWALLIAGFGLTGATLRRRRASLA